MDPEFPKRYEQTVRVSTVFFSAAMGFGLKKILDGEFQTSGSPAAPNDHWACFLIALLLFLRFLYGSANHLWSEYIRRPPTGAQKYLMIPDFGFLILFGFLGLEICYAKRIDDFFAWNSAFGKWGAVACIVEASTRWRGRREFGAWWIGWLVINLAYVGITGWAWQCYSSAGLSLFWNANWALVLLVSGCFVLLVLDLLLQLWILDKPAQS